MDTESKINYDVFTDSITGKSVKLYDWQNKAIEFFFKHNNAVFEVTTGAGKSICAIQIMKKALELHPEMYILIVVPKNVILEKMWFPELHKHGFTMKDIGVYYGSIKEGCKITITNMQNVMNLPLDIYDMVIFDEIHNFCTPRLFKLLNRNFKYKMGLSATIERFDGAHWRMLSYFDFNIFKYTPKQALDDGILNQFNFYNIGLEMEPKDYEKYDKLTQDINNIIGKAGSWYRIMRNKELAELKVKLLGLVNLRKDLVLNYPAKFKVLRELAVKHKDNKVLIFNEYNSQTTKCYWHLLEDNIKPKVLHSGVNKHERDRILNEYQQNKFNILLATKILDEGYNLPSIDVGIIMAGNSTAKQTIQRMGRILRKKDNISTLYQIYIKNTMEEDQAMERSKIFKELCNEYKEYFYENGFREV